MPPYHRDPNSFGALKDQVFVLTGGARGVAESIVRYLFAAGAHVFFGDIDQAGSDKVIAALRAKNPSATNSLVAISFDARKYDDNLALFKAAYKAHGRIDHAISCAAVTESLNWYDESLNPDTIETPPPTVIIDVNFTGVLYFARIAAVFLRQGNEDGKDKSLTIVGSIASFKEQAGLFVYGPTKHGVMGLFRSTKSLMSKKYGIRINMVNPSHVNTIMGSAVHDLWVAHGLPVNEAYHVAEHVLTLASTPKKADGTAATGIAVYVEGGEGWDIEEDLDKTDHLWMGEEMSRNSAKIDIALGTGVSWKPTKE
ncbi:unnamed protein product [Clonostachys rosea f. rosea IK726]|uniref:Uncharacterized protein n=1 Tax=Clonostachys rosea f. rosea IK726 TaxID=1349383 RepID=A0ACA9THC8_BIOOC|nr:unnamed protein product [Clonostachys rosea f. rosea IK726]